MSSREVEALYSKVAKKILSESLGLRKGENVTVETWNNGLGFARRVVAEARAAGAAAILTLEDERAYLEGVRRSPRDRLGLMGRHEYGLLAETDAYVFIPGPVLGVYSTKLRAKEKEESTRYNDSWYEAARKAKLRGVRMAYGYVGAELARLLGKSVQEVVAGQLKASLVDYRALSKTASRLASSTRDGSKATLSSGDELLTWKWKGELELQAGIVGADDVAQGSNMKYIPPGYVYKEVDPRSVNGTVRISPSITTYGYVDGAVLRFEKGTLVGWEDARPEKLVERLVEPVPAKSRKLIWATVGINPKMRYGFGQDRFVSGSVAFGGFGFIAAVRNGTLTSGSAVLVQKGKVVGRARAAR